MNTVTKTPRYQPPYLFSIPAQYQPSKLLFHAHYSSSTHPPITSADAPATHNSPSAPPPSHAAAPSNHHSSHLAAAAVFAPRNNSAACTPSSPADQATQTVESPHNPSTSTAAQAGSAPGSNADAVSLLVMGTLHHQHRSRREERLVSFLGGV